MIKSFDHKGLERLFNDGSKRGIPPVQAQKLTDILDRLDAAVAIQDMNYPGAGLHPLKGNKKGYWAVKVTGNWRVTFQFENGDASSINLEDYH